MIDQFLDGSMVKVHTNVFSVSEHVDPLNIGLDYFEQGGVDLVQRLATISPSENLIAERLMDDVHGWLPGLVHPLCEKLTGDATFPHPLLGVTAEPTIIWSPIDTLIREMIGWQTHEVPGGWTLKTPPRSSPENWTVQDDGLIRPIFTPVDDFMKWDRNLMFVGYFGVPRWHEEERESVRASRAEQQAADDQTFMGMIQASTATVEERYS